WDHWPSSCQYRQSHIAAMTGYNGESAMPCRHRFEWLFALGTLLAVAWTDAAKEAAFARDVEPLAIGAEAPELNLPGVDGKKYSLEDFKEARVLVVVFTCNHCPTAQAYEERIINLHAYCLEKGAALVAISPNDPLAVRLDELGYSDIGDSFD